MEDELLAGVRALRYMDLQPHRDLLAKEMLTDPAALDRGVASAVSAHLGRPVAVADLPPDVADHARQEVRRAVRRFITDR
jgi:hypothetical protein